MEEHVSKVENSFPLLFEKKSSRFKECFCLLFGSEIKETAEIFYIAEEYRKIMWATTRNGRKITKEDIYDIRGRSVILLRGTGNHHWPSRIENVKKKIEIPINFHFAWHGVHFDLWKRKDIRNYWKILLYGELPCNSDAYLKRLSSQIIKDNGGIFKADF